MLQVIQTKVAEATLFNLYKPKHFIIQTILMQGRKAAVFINK